MIAEPELQGSNVRNVKRGLASGAVWMMCARLLVRVIGLCSTIILARLLVPEDFGLISLAAMAVGMIEMAGELGMEMALIRDQNASRNHYDTVWTIKIIIGVLTSSTLALLAIPLAVFFDEPRLPYILYALAFSLFISSFANIGVVNFTKDLMFNKVFLQQAASKSVNFIITISLALAWRDYWALVVGIVSTKILSTIFTYIIHPYRPRPCLSEWREIIHFSKWIYVARVSRFINRATDRFVIGKLSNSSSVGIFSVALELSNLVTTELVAPLQKAAFPAYSKLAHESELLKNTYLEVLSLLLLITLPITTGILLTSDLLIKVLLGDNWLEAIPILGVLAIHGIIYAAGSQSHPLFMSINKPKIPAYLTSSKTIVFVPLFYFGMSNYGLLGAAWACVITSTLFFVIDLLIIRKLAGVSLTRMFSKLWRPIVSSMIMAVIVLAIRNLLNNKIDSFFENIYELFLSTLIGASVYFSSISILWILNSRPSGAEEICYNLISNKIVKLRKNRIKQE